MRLATLRRDGGTDAVVISPEGAVAVPGYADIGALLRDEAVGLEAAAAAVDSLQPADYQKRDLARPVLEPRAIVCVGLNYRTHILEMGRDLPVAPTLFSKLSRAMTDPYADVALPAASSAVDYEGELAVVIGRRGRNVAVENAWGHVGGLTVLNDVTARDFQKRTLQWFAGKTFQSSTPWGPWLVTADELGPLDRLELSLDVNGEERQRAPLGDLVFSVPALIADISRIVELEPGDVIATGTPGGVGHAQGKVLAPEDVVTVAIDGIGEISSRFVAAAR